MSFKSAKIPGGHVRWTVLWANAVSSGGVRLRERQRRTLFERLRYRCHADLPFVNYLNRKSDFTSAVCPRFCACMNLALLQGTIGKFRKICGGLLAGWLRPSLAPPHPHVDVRMAYCALPLIVERDSTTNIKLASAMVE